MATARIKGTASITYTPVGGVSTEHVLAVPLLISPSYGFGFIRNRTRWEAWNSDGTAREVFVQGDETHEIVGQIRFDDEPIKLRDLLVSGLEDDVTLTYTPDGVTDYPCLLVDVLGEGGKLIQPDDKRYGLGEWMSTVRLRRVDGGTFDALL